MTSCASLVLCGDGTAVVWSLRRSSDRGRQTTTKKKNIAECLPVLRADLLADVRPPIPVTDHLASERTHTGKPISKAFRVTIWERELNWSRRAWTCILQMQRQQHRARGSWTFCPSYLFSAASSMHHEKTRTIAVLPYLSHHFLWMEKLIKTAIVLRSWQHTVD